MQTHICAEKCTHTKKTIIACNARVCNKCARSGSAVFAGRVQCHCLDSAFPSHITQSSRCTVLRCCYSWCQFPVCITPYDWICVRVFCVCFCRRSRIRGACVCVVYLRLLSTGPPLSRLPHSVRGTLTWRSLVYNIEQMFATTTTAETRWIKWPHRIFSHWARE